LYAQHQAFQGHFGVKNQTPLLANPASQHNDSGSPISGQLSTGTDVPVRIFLIPFSTLAEFVISDAYQKRILFQTFQSFNRFAPFKTSQSRSGSSRFKSSRFNGSRMTMTRSRRSKRSIAFAPFKPLRTKAAE
jgi:hypothetical protein